MSAQSVSIFVSYAKADELYRRQLETHLSALQRQGFISLWHDGQIQLGENQTQTRDVHLERAMVILLLVSADFIASDYCYSVEMKHALKRHEAGLARVIPIVVRPCDWQRLPVASLQILPLDAKPISLWSSPDEAWTQVTVSLRSIVEDLLLLRANAPAKEAQTSALQMLRVQSEFYSCFLSYSSEDQSFVEQLYDDLQHHGVHCWFAPRDLKIGDPFRQRIHEAIRSSNKLLLVLSSHSIASPWVEAEVAIAFEEERRSNLLVLFPIMLDNSVMLTNRAWAVHIRQTRHIGNFTRWKERERYLESFRRLLRDLKVDSPSQFTLPMLDHQNSVLHPVYTLSRPEDRRVLPSTGAQRQAAVTALPSSLQQLFPLHQRWSRRMVLLAGTTLVGGGIATWFAVSKGKESFLAQSVSSSLAGAHSRTPPSAVAPPTQPLIDRPDFQTGMAFPRWAPGAYGTTDTAWQNGLQNINTQTGAKWIQMPLLFSQALSSSTSVTPDYNAPSLTSFAQGIRTAHALGYRVFVTPLIAVQGDQHWAGSIHFDTYEQEQRWFDSYWRVLQPYVEVAAQTNVEQLAIGTETEWLQENAPNDLWNELIERIHGAFSGSLTYNMNWTTLSTQPEPRPWMRNPFLTTIGVSAYFSLIDTPQSIESSQIVDLWNIKVKGVLDGFAMRLGKPILISEIGYRNSADALYRAYSSQSSAKTDPEMQAAACNAVLANVATDPNISGVFFWAWDNAGSLSLRGLPAVSVIHSYYAAFAS